MPEWRTRFNALIECRDAEAVADILTESFDEYRRLFYGWPKAEFDRIKFEYENIFHDILAGPLANVPSLNYPRQIQGLLVLFGSFFERSGMYAALVQVSSCLPDVSAKHELQALYLIKSVANAEHGYLDCMDAILESLGQAREREDILADEVCSWILKEYASISLSNMNRRNFRANAEAFSVRLDELRNAGNLNWCSGRVALPVHADSESDLSVSTEEAHSNIVEGLFDQACLLAGFPTVEEPEPVLGETVRSGEASSLPDYLEDALFEEHEARYQKIPNAVLQGLDADEEQNRIYLGTYFPRSYLEVFNITGEMFQVEYLRNQLLCNKPVLHILDVGSGTGGTLCGLIQSLHDAGYRGRYDILSVDGNQGALDYQKSLLDKVKDRNGLLLELKQECTAFPTIFADCQARLTDWHSEMNGTFDIVLSWKCLSEFYNTNYAQAIGIVTAFMNRFENLLKEDGLCIIADVTCKDAGNHEWIPIIINREIHAATRSEMDLASIMPLSCLRWANQCRSHKDCYTQRSFRISHRQASEMCTISYRVLARQEMLRCAQTGHTGLPAYRISPNNICQDGIARRNSTGYYASAFTFAEG